MAATIITGGSCTATLNYIVTGGGGAPPHGKYLEDPRLQKYEEAFHSCLLYVWEDRWELEVDDVDGRRLDEVVIGRGPKAGGFRRVAAYGESYGDL